MRDAARSSAPRRSRGGDRGPAAARGIGRPRTIVAKRAASIIPASSSPTSVAPSAAACASSPSTTICGERRHGRDTPRRSLRVSRCASTSVGGEAGTTGIRRRSSWCSCSARVLVAGVADEQRPATSSCTAPRTTAAEASASHVGDRVRCDAASANGAVARAAPCSDSRRTVSEAISSSVVGGHRTGVATARFAKRSRRRRA